MRQVFPRWDSLVALPNVTFQTFWSTAAITSHNMDNSTRPCPAPPDVTAEGESGSAASVVESACLDGTENSAGLGNTNNSYNGRSEGDEDGANLMDSAEQQWWLLQDQVHHLFEIQREVDRKVEALTPVAWGHSSEVGSPRAEQQLRAASPPFRSITQDTADIAALRQDMQKFKEELRKIRGQIEQSNKKDSCCIIT